MIKLEIFNIDFVNDSAYRLVRWAPAVSTRKQHYTGGEPYEDVVEEMEIVVSGTQALDKLAAAAEVIEQSAHGGWSAAMTINAQMTGAPGDSEYAAVIAGPPGPGEPVLILPDRFTDTPALGVIDPVIFRFKRRGLWTKFLAETATTSSVAHPTTVSISSAVAARAYSPYALSLGGMVWNEKIVWNSYILTATGGGGGASAAKKIVILDAEDLAVGSGGTTSVNDATNKARGNNVLRFTFSGATTISGQSKDISSLVYTTAANLRPQSWQVFASVRNNSDSANFSVRVWSRHSGVRAYSQPVIIPADANSNNPHWVNLGRMAQPRYPHAINLEVTSTGAGTLDIDTIALLCTTDELADRAIAIQARPALGDTGDLGSAHELRIYGQSDFPVRLYRSSPFAERPQNYTGSPYLFLPPGDDGHAFAWLACGNYNPAYWRATDASGNVITSSFTRILSRGELTLP